MNSTPLPPELKRGQTYRVGATIARGGMGAILSADDPGLRRTVAMKVMLSGRNADSESLRRFVQEAHVLAQLEHPNIVPIHELGLDERGCVFYTMKLIKGVTLRAVLEGLKAGDAATLARYPFNQLLTVFQKVCDALAFAHARGIIHRDLKPDNIMLGDFGEVLVMDWGLAKVLSGETVAEGPGPAPVLPEAAPSKETLAPPSAPDQATVERPSGVSGDTQHTLEGSVMGSPHFMAPEQAAGRIQDLDARTDIFALGGILYNLLALHPPMAGDTVREILENIQAGRITPAAGAAAHCPGGEIPEPLMAVATKALATDPARRYANVAKLKEDIAAYQSGFATGAEQAGFARLLWLMLQRNKTVPIATAILLVMTAGFFGKIVASERKARTNLENLQKTAPIFFDQARTLREQRKIPEALDKVEFALTLAPTEVGFLLLKGDLLQTQRELSRARAVYAQALQLEPDNSLAKQNIELCDKLTAATEGGTNWSPAALQLFDAALIKQGRTAEAIHVQEIMPAGNRALHDTWKARLEQAGLKAGFFVLDADNKFRLRFDNLPVDDLTPLQGMPVKTLNVNRTKIRSIAPLRGMPLTSLDCAAAIASIEPLRGMALIYLNLSGSQVTDLAPLRAMPLTSLSLMQTPVSDIRPLQGLALTNLNLNDTKVADLEPLRGMPLRWLEFYVTPVTNLSSLAGMPLESLRCYQTRIRDLTPLRGLALKHLNVGSSKIEDLTVLRGMPLRDLRIGDTPVGDLAPLRGMLLTNLDCSFTRVTNLEPLQEMPLEYLNLRGTPVSDLGPLAGMPLRHLLLAECAQLKSLHGLRGFAKLELVSLPSQVSDVEFLRQLPALRIVIHSVNNRWQTNGVADFWAARATSKKD